MDSVVFSWSLVLPKNIALSGFERLISGRGPEDRKKAIRFSSGADSSQITEWPSSHESPPSIER